MFNWVRKGGEGKASGSMKARALDLGPGEWSAGRVLTWRAGRGGGGGRRRAAAVPLITFLAGPWERRVVDVSRGPPGPPAREPWAKTA